MPPVATQEGLAQLRVPFLLAQRQQGGGDVVEVVPPAAIGEVDGVHPPLVDDRVVRLEILVDQPEDLAPFAERRDVLPQQRRGGSEDLARAAGDQRLTAPRRDHLAAAEQAIAVPARARETGRRHEARRDVVDAGAELADLLDDGRVDRRFDDPSRHPAEEDAPARLRLPWQQHRGDPRAVAGGDRLGHDQTRRAQGEQPRPLGGESLPVVGPGLTDAQQEALRLAAPRSGGVDPEGDVRLPLQQADVGAAQPVGGEHRRGGPHEQLALCRTVEVRERLARPLDGPGFRPQISTSSRASTGSPSVASPGALTAPCAQRATSMLSARPATVGSSKKACSGTSSWKASRKREASWVVSSEWPPRSKKLSWMPTCSTWSRSRQIRTKASSVGVRGAAYGAA